MVRSQNESSLVALGHMRVPRASGLRLHMREAGARRRIGDADKDIARRTLDLPAGELRLALQWLVTVRTIEFEFVRVHKLLPHHAQTGDGKYMKDLSILSVRRIRM
jgi:hypothetical protein